MMNDVNGWLLALSGLLGLVLTLASTVRRVEREVPVGDSASDATDDKTP